MKRCTTNTLKALRALMSKHNLNAYIVPSEDAHMSEYVAECDKRREHVSGFSGSAGTALVMQSQALLWTDGRYFLQAEMQLDDNWRLMRAFTKDVPTLTEYLSSGDCQQMSRVGFDPETLPYGRYNEMKTSLQSSGIALVPLPGNLVDAVWTDRPCRPIGEQLHLLGVEATGALASEKLRQLRHEMGKTSTSLLVLSALDDVAWLFNYRAMGVIPYSPVMFAYCLITPTESHLFADVHSRAMEDFKRHLAESEVKLHEYAEFQGQLERLVGETGTGRVWLDHQASAAIGLAVPETRIFSGNSPASVLKAVKSEAELAGMARAHVLDSVPLCRYLDWLERQVAAGAPVTEVSGAEELHRLRAEMEDFVDLSFESISGSGPNGAIIHYKSTPETDRPITADDVYLIDSGGHYRCGTTDVTRTVQFGSPTAQLKRHYTLVLKGHIALSRLTFPEEVRGSRLDTHARVSLWQSGLEYQHGTGHGVGVFLNVHEGPCGISGARGNPHEIGLKRGMIVTIEPGFYLKDQYGIRVENVVEIVRQESITNGFDGLQFLTFKPITLVPISTKLIDRSLLTREEVDWINQYHAEVRRVIGAELKTRGFASTYDWLLRETAEI